LFVYKEARLLDEGEFEAWLDLYAPHGIYWMPSKPGQTDPQNVASIIYEDHGILSIRVDRLLEARALVLTPMPRTVHMVSNVEVLSGEAGSEEFKVGSVFMCTEIQGERHRIYSGRQVHHIAREGDSFRIRHKRVDLLNCDGVHTPMTIPI
jgi:3-phenylpropionate/cinnamic acid dioxygenase small subunit